MVALLQLVSAIKHMHRNAYLRLQVSGLVCGSARPEASAVQLLQTLRRALQKHRIVQLGLIGHRLH
jgi:hypothetical protein